MVAPLIQQSAGRLKGLASTIRRQQFITKTELGPQTTQAIAEAGLEQERLERQTTARVSLQAGVERERLETQERISREQIQAQERISREQIQAARKARKRAEPSFVETLFGK